MTALVYSGETHARILIRYREPGLPLWPAGMIRRRDEGPPPNCDARWGALMGRAQSGDSAAYLALLRDIEPYLLTMTSRNAADGARMETEAALQDILLALHALRHSYAPSRSFCAWLSGIAAARLERGASMAARGSMRSRHASVPMEIPAKATADARNLSQVSNLPTSPERTQAMPRWIDAYDSPRPLSPLEGTRHSRD